MKIFIYKSLLIFLFIFITFHLTFNYALRSIERKIDTIGSKENIEIFQNEIRAQIKESIQKDKILNKEDAILLRKFLEKVRSEIYKQD
tara:strand:- start:375 stop:638 length:264 start_codon:yes stop_codon:yes gene_type:complete